MPSPATQAFKCIERTGEGDGVTRRVLAERRGACSAELDSFCPEPWCRGPAWSHNTPHRITPRASAQAVGGQRHVGNQRVSDEAGKTGAAGLDLCVTSRREGKEQVWRG